MHARVHVPAGVNAHARARVHAGINACMSM